MKNFEKYIDTFGLIFEAILHPVEWQHTEDLKSLHKEVKNIAHKYNDQIAGSSTTFEDWLLQDATPLKLSELDKETLHEFTKDIIEDIKYIRKKLSTEGRLYIEICYDESNSNVEDLHYVYIPCGAAFGRFEDMPLEMKYRKEDFGL